MKIVAGGQTPQDNRPKFYGWQEGADFFLSAVKEARIVHGQSYRPSKRFNSKEEAEAEATARGRTIEWR